ncbi:MAG: hypothetical protein WEB63_04965 [Cucumibacter sp.]
MFRYVADMTGLIGIPAGTFKDPSFPPPNRFYWTVHQHHWLPLPDGLPSMEKMQA